MRYHRLSGLGMGELGFNMSNIQSNIQRHECEKRGGVYSYKPGARYPGAQGTALCDGKVMFMPRNTFGMPAGDNKLEMALRREAQKREQALQKRGQVIQNARKMVVQQEQFNNGCNPAEPAGGICTQAMTTWWTVRADSPSGVIVHAAKDEGKARSWASQWEAQRGPNNDTNNLMPEPTAVDMPAPGSDTEQGVAVRENTILGMKPQTALLGGAAVVALILFTRG